MPEPAVHDASPAQPVAASPPDLDALRARVRPFEEAELALERAVVGSEPWISEREENGLRYALNLARVTRVRAPDGQDVDLTDFLAPWREEVLPAIEPALLRGSGIDRRSTAQLAEWLAQRARAWRRQIAETFAGRLPIQAVDREVCEKALVLVCGGGGGVAYVALGGFALLEQYNIAPRFLAGASMGSILLLFRARRIHYSAEEIADVVRKLSFRTLFRFLQTESRYGLPAAMRLYLRHGIGEFLKGPDGHPLTLGQLPIPFIVAVTGVRNGALPHDASYYENLVDVSGPALLRPHAIKRMASRILNTTTELVTQRERFVRLYLGSDEHTRDFDAIDAVGFSSALPGVIHYDVLREDERMHQLLSELFARYDLFRLVDGGISDNVPARAAWAKVQEGVLGTRNAFVLALDGFAPKIGQPLWFGLEQVVAQNVARNRPYIHVHKAFTRVLSPIEVVPGERQLQRVIQWGKQELLPDMPLIARMLRPFPALV
ncbi:MAG TPA: patatin-like phospholipase family protein [Anaeromyxobacteraceae bacterium]|nr:patatin-like phospholipase family protein [Anaeromyxobacteraceae bacterium]